MSGLWQVKPRGQTTGSALGLLLPCVCGADAIMGMSPVKEAFAAWFYESHGYPIIWSKGGKRSVPAIHHEVTDTMEEVGDFWEGFKAGADWFEKHGGKEDANEGG